MLKGLAVLLSTIALLTACESDEGYQGHPGDRFFKAVVTGTNQNTWQDFSGSMNLVMFDPEQAANRTQGTVGTDPNKNEVWGQFYPETGAAVTVTGTWEGDTFEASGEGWTFEGETNGPEVEATVTGPNGEEGQMNGYDTFDTMVGSFCGTYSGSSSGRWNFVVAGTGSVTGGFTGGETGTLSGYASGDNLKIKWRSGDGEASGSASGTIGDDGVIRGEWSGKSGWFSASGTWQSDSNCSPAEPAPAATNWGCIVGCCCSLDVCVCH